MDNCQTPPYALEPLLPYLDPFRRQGLRIWEPAKGEGYLARALKESGYSVVAGDISQGADFFKYVPWFYGAIVTNPPYSQKQDWIEHCYYLGKPFALLVPVETIGLPYVQSMMEQQGAELLLLDKRVNFKMPNAGWGGTAQFPVLWFCRDLLPKTICYGQINRVNMGELA